MLISVILAYLFCIYTLDVKMLAFCHSENDAIVSNDEVITTS